LLATEAAGLARQRGEAARVRASLDEALALLEALRQGHPDDTEIQDALGDTRYGLGLFTLFSLGDPRAAIGEFERAVTLYQDLSQREPEVSDWRYRLAILFGQCLSVAYLDLERTEESIAANRRALEVLDSLAREDPGNGRWAHALAWEHIRRGNIAEAAGDLEEAAAGFRRSAEIHDRLLSRSSGKPAAWQDGLAVAYEALAGILEKSGGIAEAIKVAERSLATRRLMVDVEEQNLFHAAGLASIEIVLGRLRAAQGDRDGALSILREAGELLAGMTASKPENVSVREDLAAADLALGRQLQGLGETDSARLAFERCLLWLGAEADDEAADPHHLEILVESWLRLDRNAEAVPLLRRLRTGGWPAGGDPGLIQLVTARGL
jgi:tetratricopeptide (TPR) repeat protein